MSVEINDNSKEVSAAIKAALLRGLEKVGLAAEGYAKNMSVEIHNREDMMAKDDYHVIVYQILAYLYQCLKSGEKVDTKMLCNDSAFFVVDGKALSDKYWCYILYNLQKMQLIDGIAFSGRVDGYSFERPLRWENCMITPVGIEYLTDNAFLAKAKEFLKDVKAIAPFA